MEEESPTTTMSRNQEEPKIPVFTVIKNGAILKNIFVVNNSTTSAGAETRNVEETLLVGRHPDCSIVLTHPSISRFHLRIHTVTLSQKLAVTDLSSVHGTWVSGVKVKAETRVHMKEGDTIQLGGSSRIYRLHWMPLSHAYDSATPFVPDLDVQKAEDKEDNAFAIHQDENVMLETKKIQIDSLKMEDNEKELADASKSVSTEERNFKSIDSVLDGMSTIFVSEDSELHVKKENPSAPLVPEGVTYMFHQGGVESSSCGSFGTKLNSSAAVEGSVLETEIHKFENYVQCHQPFSVMETLSEGETHINEAICFSVGEKYERRCGDNWEEKVMDSPRCGSAHTKSMNLSSSENSVISENRSQRYMRDKQRPEPHEEETNIKEAISFSVGEKHERICEDNWEERVVDSPRCGSSPTKSMNLSSGENSVISENGNQLYMRDKQRPEPIEVAGMEISYCTKFTKFSSPVEAVSSETESHQSMSHKQSIKQHSVIKPLSKDEGSPFVNLSLALKFDSFRFSEVVESYVETEPSNERVNQNKMEAMCSATEFSSKSVREIIDSSNKLSDDGDQVMWNMFGHQSINKGSNSEFEATERKLDFLVKLDPALAEEFFCGAEKAGVTDIHTTWNNDSIHCENRKASPAPLKDQSVRSSISVWETSEKARDNEQSIKERKSDLLINLDPVLAEEVFCSAEKGVTDTHSTWKNDSIHSDNWKTSPATIEDESVRSSISVREASEKVRDGLAVRQMLDSPPARSLKKNTPQSHSSSGLTERRALEALSARSQKNFSLTSARSGSLKPAGVLQTKEEKSQGRSSQVATATCNTMKMKQSTKVKRLLKEFSSGSNWEEDEALTPGKENRDPQHSCSSGLSQRLVIESPTNAAKNIPSLSRRGKSAGIIHVRTESNQVKPFKAGTDRKDGMKLQENVEDKAILPEFSSGVDAKDDVKLLDIVEDKSILKEFSSGVDGDKGEVYTLDKETINPNALMSKSMKQTGQVGNIEKFKPWKATTEGDTDKEGGEVFTPDKENLTPTTLMLRSMKKKGELQNIENSEPLNSKTYEVDVGIDFHPSTDLFASPNKVNQAPEKVFREQSVKTNTHNESATENKKGRLQNIEDSKPLNSTTYEVYVDMDFCPSTDLFDSPGKVNQAPEEVFQEQQSAKTNTHNKSATENKNFTLNRRAERVPFQSLPVNSESFIPSSPQSSTLVDLSQYIPEKKNPAEMCKLTKWIMFVDTASLLDKDSRKALELLQGIKRTRLFIPRTVIRELDSLRRCESLFRKTLEASEVLQWIEDSMVTTNWWIEVQSSKDEARLTAPTPPASPQSLACWEIPSSGSWLTAGHNFTGILSPTPEDRVLDCALHYRKMNNHAQTILISNDVNVKINAMAEGLLCETANDFRESLVNPFSERFLWTSSSPRGLTWNCLEDVVLKENYYPSPRTKLSKREAKGLKLILLHNTRYGRI